MKFGPFDLIGKLIGLAGIGGSLTHLPVIHRFLEGIVTIIALTIVSAMMTAMLLVSGFYGLYVVLTRYGLSDDAALISMIGLCFLLTAGLVMATLWHLRDLRAMPARTLPKPPLTRVTEVTHAFIEGFKTQRATNIR